MFENCPNPLVDHRGKGSLKVVSYQRRNIAGVHVFAFGFVGHGVDSPSRIEVHDIVEEIPKFHKTILNLVGNNLVVWLKDFDIRSNYQFIIRILQG